MAFEEELGRYSVLLSQSVDYVIWAVIGIIVVGVLAFIAYMQSFKLSIVIKERIGKPFKADTQIRVIKTEGEELSQPTDKLASLLGTPREEKKEEYQENLVTAIPTRTKTYRGRVVKKDGKWSLSVYRPLKRPLKLKIVGAEFWNFTGDSNKRLELLKLSENIYAPLVVTCDDEIYTKAIDDQTWVDWVINDIEDDNKKFRKISFWDRYGSFVLTAMTFGLCIIFVFVVFKNMQVFADAGRSGASALADACIDLTSQVVG